MWLAETIRQAQFMKAYHLPISAYNELDERKIEALLIIDREIKLFQNEQRSKNHGR